MEEEEEDEMDGVGTMVAGSLDVDCDGGGTWEDGMNIASAACWVWRRVFTTSKGVTGGSGRCMGKRVTAGAGSDEG